MHSRHRNWFRAAAAAGASLLAMTAAGARAQEAGTAPPAQTGSGQVEPADTQQGEPVAGGDVVVTARKTNERLQDVPLSVNAVSGDQLRDRGAVDVKDVLRSIPGFSFSGTERGQSNYNIRGVSTVASSPTVGVYLDDISLVTVATNFSGAFDPVFFDMERLEVLKGPQGTLYGGSSMGGAIKYVSARPDPTRIGISAAAGLATTEHGGLSYNAENVANVPLVQDKLALRVGMFYRHDAGYVDNGPGQLVNSRFSSTPSPTYTPRSQNALSTRVDDDQNSGNTYALRASIEWKPDASWSIRPQIFYQDYELKNPGYYFPNQPGLRSSWRLRQPTQDEGGIYSLQVDKEFGAATLTSLTAYFDRNLHFTRDYSFFVPNILPIPFYDLVYQNANIPNVAVSNTETFSQEVRLASSGERRFKWLAGLFYSDQRDRLVQEVTIPGFAPILGTEQAYLGNTFTGTKQYAAFGEATLTLFDRLDLTAGARVFKIDQSVDIFATGPLAQPADLRGRKSKEDGVNPKVGLSFRATRDNLLYASAAKGFRPGGPNRFVVSSALCAADLAQIGRTSAPDTFDSDNVWTYEVGTKNSFGGGRGVFNAAAFYTDWNKIQQRVTLGGCGFEFTTNAGSAKVKGAEAEGRFNLTRAFQVGGTATYTDAKLDNAVAGTPIQADDQTLSVPKWMASAFAGYSAEIGDGRRLNLRGEYQYQSRARRDFNRTLPVVYSNGVAGLVPNRSEFRQGYEVVNASASIVSGGTEVRLYANNLADKRPFIDYILNAGSDVATTIRPRTIGMEIRQRF